MSGDREKRLSHRFGIAPRRQRCVPFQVSSHPPDCRRDDRCVTRQGFEWRQPKTFGERSLSQDVGRAEIVRQPLHGVHGGPAEHPLRPVQQTQRVG